MNWTRMGGRKSKDKKNDFPKTTYSIFRNVPSTAWGEGRRGLLEIAAGKVMLTLGGFTFRGVMGKRQLVGRERVRGMF